MAKKAVRTVITLACTECKERNYVSEKNRRNDQGRICLLYTSDAADERSSVDLGGRRIIKKKKKEQKGGCGCATNTDDKRRHQQ